MFLTISALGFLIILLNKSSHSALLLLVQAILIISYINEQYIMILLSLAIMVVAVINFYFEISISQIITKASKVKLIISGLFVAIVWHFSDISIAINEQSLYLVADTNNIFYLAIFAFVIFAILVSTIITFDTKN